MASLQPNKEFFGGTRSQAENAAELAYRPALREIERQRRLAGQQYKWNKREVEPEYARLV